MSKTVTLQFSPANEPPDDDRMVLCCDGETYVMGWHDPKSRFWFCADGSDWPEVKSWSDLPKAKECLERANG